MKVCPVCLRDIEWCESQAVAHRFDLLRAAEEAKAAEDRADRFVAHPEREGEWVPYREGEEA